MYIAAVRAVFVYERRQLAVPTLPATSPERSMELRAAVRGYLVAAAVVVAAGSWMPFVGKTIAELMGWHQTLVGTLFVALATSLPELAVTISALRIGALDMAIADLLGSNLFDILILGIDDLAYLPGSLLRHVSPLNAATALSAMMMSGVAIVGLLYRDRSRLFRTMGWTSLVLVSVYLLNATVLYLARG
jgi:cation:H+ antiporter